MDPNGTGELPNEGEAVVQDQSHQEPETIVVDDVPPILSIPDAFLDSKNYSYLMGGVTSNNSEHITADDNSAEQQNHAFTQPYGDQLTNRAYQSQLPYHQTSAFQPYTPAYTPQIPFEHTYVTSIEQLPGLTHTVYHCCGGKCQIFAVNKNKVSRASQTGETTNDSTEAMPAKRSYNLRLPRKRRHVFAAQVDEKTEELVKTMVQEFKRDSRKKKTITKSGKTRVSKHEKDLMHNIHEVTNFPSMTLCLYIAEELCMDLNQVRSWFYRHREEETKRIKTTVSVDVPAFAHQNTSNSDSNTPVQAVKPEMSSFYLMVSPQGRKDRGVPLAKLTTALVQKASDDVYVDMDDDATEAAANDEQIDV